MSKDVIIFGTGATRDQCTFNAETWGVNTSYVTIHNMQGRLDKLFIGHNPNPYPLLWSAAIGLRYPGDNWGWEYIDGLSKMGIDVITLHKIPNVQSRLYPLKRIIKKFDCDYFSDTICYMLAYAIDKEYEEIKIYGVDMSDKLEYIYEKGGIEYWVGFARGRGIDVWIAPGSNVCRTRTGRAFGTAEDERMAVWQQYGGQELREKETYY